MRQMTDDYRNLLHSMEDGFCMIQLLCEGDEAADYVFLDVNDSYEQQTGIRGVRGRRMSEIAPSHGERFLEVFRHIVRTGQSRRFDFTAPEGERCYEGHAYRLDSVDHPTIAIMTHDVTAHKRREQELSDMTRALEQGIAQRVQEVVRCQEQLRAMAAELTFAEQRERKRLATELHDDLGERLLLTRLKLGQIQQRAMLDTSTEELLQEADKVLTRALAYTHTVVADLSPLVLQDLGMPAAVKWLGERMQQHGLAVTVQSALPSDLALPEAHAVFLFQSVRELLMNVLKHAACRGASVYMTMAGGQLQIEVRDEGVGGASSPADSSPRPSQFGLFSIRERIGALGGTFHIDSRSHEGTTVTLKLPLGPSAVQEGRRSEEDAEGSDAARPATGRIIRVLLVDDHAMVRQGLRSVLDAYPDIKVIGEAADGEVACRLASELLPTVVLMDINMPGCNGIEATRRIKAQYPEMSVIGLSVDADGHNQEAMLKAGAYSLMTKEAAVEQLYSLIYEAVKPGVIPFRPLRR